MAKTFASDAIMGPDKMKPLLTLSKREPVQAAIGLTSAGEGLILLDKKAKPRKVFAMLRASAAKAKIDLNSSSLRFGRAEVDTDYDAGTVRFYVNKDAPGMMRAKLIEVVKRIPYQKVEFHVDPGLNEQPEDENDAEQPTGATPAEPPTLDAAGLKQRLTALAQLIPQALAADPSRKDALLGEARQGQTLLAANSLAEALASIDRLEAVLGAPRTAPGVPAASAPASDGDRSAVRYAKARLAWLAVRRQMQSDLETLRQKLLEFYEDTDIVAALNRSYNDRVEPVLTALDESLADALDDATNATDPAKREELTGQARAIIGRYQQFLGSEPLLREIDGNPFVKLSIAATISRTLAALSAAV